MPIEIIVSLATIMLLFGPFIARYVFWDSTVPLALFGDGRVFGFWLVGFGLLFYFARKADSRKDRANSWLYRETGGGKNK